MEKSNSEVRSMIKETVHHLYYDFDTNCAITTITCLGKIFGVEFEKQTIDAALGMHGAGGFRAQCGLVEGGLMFLGIYLSRKGRRKEEIVKACHDYGKTFTKQFGSLRCRDLRPDGFREGQPPHMCEKLTCEAIDFTYKYVKVVESGFEQSP